MIMRTDELEKKIQKNIKNNLNHKELLNISNFLNLQLSGRKTLVQEKLLDYIKTLNYNTLSLLSNKIDEYMKVSATSKSRQVVNSRPLDVNRGDIAISHLQSEKLTDIVLKSAPIDLESEVPVQWRSDLTNINNYGPPNHVTSVPTQAVAGGNDRSHFVRIPNMLPSVSIDSSPFYCCSICLHPLTLLVPLQMPNVVQNARVTSKASLNFTLTENAKQIIHKNLFSVNSKTDYKWQVLLRFVSIDPSKSIPSPNDDIKECIPPYLQIAVNGLSQPLWEILPSNCRTKEGKRHPKAVQISDKLTDKNRNNQGYNQTVIINWWQTQGVFMYYYVGVYLERKLTVNEIMTLFTSNQHINNRPIEYTLNLIRSKLGNVSKPISKGAEDEDDDEDLVMSNVLPINLCCPVGKSRIEIPLRTINCQHLQCFDALLFLSMNERRAVWKCPICDNSAKPSDLFCDKYFEKILKHFKNDEDVTDVNVHPDHSFVAMKRTRDRGDREMNDKGKTMENPTVIQELDTSDRLIVLDSDEEESENEAQKQPPSIIANETPKETDQVPRTTKSSDIRLKGTNARESVHVQIRTSDSSTSEIERRIPVTSNSQTSKEATNSPAPVHIADPITQTPVSTCSELIPPITAVSTPSYSTSLFLPTCTPHMNVPLFAMPKSSTTLIPSTIQTPVLAPATTNASSTLPAPAHKNSTFHIDSPSSPPKFQSSVMKSSSLFTTANNNQSIFNSAPNFSFISALQTTIPTAIGSPITVVGSNKTAPVTPISNNATVTAAPKPLLAPKSMSTAHPDSISSKPRTSSDLFGIEQRKSKEPQLLQPLANPFITTATSLSNTSGSPAQFRFDMNSPVSQSMRLHNLLPTVATPLVQTDVPSKTNEGSRAAVNKTGSQHYDRSLISDVVRTLPVFMPLQSQKNRSDSKSGEPITCLDYSLQTPETANRKETPSNPEMPTPVTVSADQVTEIQKRPKIYQSKIPPPNKLIPAVTIDLTEEEDEAPQAPPTNNNNNSSSSRIGSSSTTTKQLNTKVTWMPLTTPIGNHLKVNGTTGCAANRYTLMDKAKRDNNNKRPAAECTYNYYKPNAFQMRPSKPGPIDLTLDEDEDSPPKKFRAVHSSSSVTSKTREDVEDGQLCDNESCSSENSLRFSNNNKPPPSSQQQQQHSISKKNLTSRM